MTHPAQSPRVAIVGVGGVFPGAAEPDAFWAVAHDGVDATGPVPPGRWGVDPASAFDPRVATPDRVYSTRGGFVEGFRFDPEGLNIDPDLVSRLDPMFHLALHAGRAAWRDAKTDRVDKARVGVVFGNIVLPTESASAFADEVIGRATAEAAGLAPTGEERATHPLNLHAAGLPAGLLATALGLGGGAFTLDAACASSLYALKLAADALRSGRLDAVITGGVSRPDPLYTQMGFSQLRALSAAQKARPFDARGDGLVVGEGAGMFVLKRLDDALEHGDRVYGLVAAVGLSNDVDGGLLAPNSEGQLRAMRAAYESAGWRPGDVDLIECHATGTPVGDAVEFESLKALWSDERVSPGRCVIGSHKGNFGHALTASGAAGLLRVLLAVRHRTLPPTANFEAPAAKVTLDDGPFRVLKTAEDWAPRQGKPRRAAVSGFGFGGINAHALIEEWVEAEDDPLSESGGDIPGHRPDSPFMTPPPTEGGPGGVEARRPPPASPETPRNPPFVRGDGKWRSSPGITDSTDVPPVEPAAIAVVGIGASFGSEPGVIAFERRVFDRAQPDPDVRHVDALRIPLDTFRIPPKELEAMLPQQTLALLAAAEAIADAGWTGDRPRLRAGVFVGIGLDPNTTNFHARWTTDGRIPQWKETLGLSDVDLASWAESVRDAVSPPLTPDRTMGALGGLIASRIAREFRVGGPSFSVSGEETSGLHAVDVAVGLLTRGELDEAVVGAVDLTGDPRVIEAARRSGVGPILRGDGAAALVLKRLDDAERDGDTIHAVIRSVSTSSGGGIDTSGRIQTQRDARDGLVEVATSARLSAPDVHVPTDVASRVGHTGSAAGTAALLRAVLALKHRVLPPIGRGGVGPRYWLRDRADGPRSARVEASGVDGVSVRVRLEEYEGADTPASPVVPGRALFAVEADDADGLARGLDRLDALSRSDVSIHEVGRRWFREAPNDPGRSLGLALVAGSADELRDGIAEARRRIDGKASPRRAAEENVFYDPAPVGRGAPVAFVFPGIGNQFPGMGRDLSALWPDVYSRLDAETSRLRSQLADGSGWDSDEPDGFEDHRAPILAQVVLGTALTDLLRAFGVEPSAVIGYSLGESAALLATRAWTERDAIHERLDAYPLFRTDLCGPCDAARRVWGLAPGEPVDWAAGIVPYSAETVRAAVREHSLSRVYPLIVNTPAECVIGGQRLAVVRLVESLGGLFVPLPVVSTVHCEIAGAVEAEYRALHTLTTDPPTGVRVYSAGWGRSYVPDRETAADAIAAQALDTVDFPAVIREAYRDGVRVFVEVGPGGSCSRMIGAILAGSGHFARSACLPGVDGVSALLNLLGGLVAERSPVDLRPLYGGEGRTPETPATRVLTVPVIRGLDIPKPPQPAPAPFREVRPTVSELITMEPGNGRADDEGGYEPPARPATRHGPAGPIGVMARQVFATETERGLAHEAFLRSTEGLSQTMSNHLAFQMALVDALTSSPPASGRPTRVTPAAPAGPKPRLDRDQCLEFAVGSIGKVLGPAFAEVDTFPTRVRLPDEPLMLVDRVTEIEGEPLSMSAGRVVTEHDVLADDWYLDHGKAPCCIVVESGQADLFLSGWLGADFVTRGLAVYRLLDAVVTFHRGLPGPGDVIRYDIRISEFFRQGDTHLFRFEFDATVDGTPVLTMRDGCAGFFSEQALAAGKGIVRRPLDLRPLPGRRPEAWAELVPMAVESYDDSQVEALRRGDLAAAFGPTFEGLGLVDPVRLPGGRMTLIHRVLTLDPTGGRYGLGLVRGELDIHPDDWFLTCHFVDDRVMPGTLMYECCLHTLRVFLSRMGWVGESDGVAYEPVPGVGGRLRCRGQVVETTRSAVFEVAIKELGYGPEPYAIADALMYADGKAVVEVTDMSLRLSGLDRDAVERLWRGAQTGPGDHLRSVRCADRFAGPGEDGPHSGPYESLPRPGPGTPILFTREQVLAFAVGDPSEAFGEHFRPFDRDRFMARLPGPPFSFLDRVLTCTAEPRLMQAGGEAVAEYDVPPDAWYFASERYGAMPFAVLIETPLQVCGWLSAYLGAALTSDEDLCYRNLGGEAVALAVVTPETGTLTTRIKATKVARSGGMILHHFDFETSAGGVPVYRGNTYFGFFRPEALANQVGIREAVPYEPTADEAARAEAFDYPTEAPFPDDALRMISRVDAFVPDGGPHGLGLIVGSIDVDPSAWFFEAHFYQDPVVPGSLGLESFLQLLKVVAVRRWGRGVPPGSIAFEPVATGETHRWVYRGQVVPADRTVTVRAVVTHLDDATRLVRADGFLSVDGRVIYGMDGFSLRMSAGGGTPGD